MKALVTGGHGFVGSFLVEKLISEGISVRCLVRKTSNLRWIKNLEVDVVYGDITDAKSLPEAVENVDLIYHVAGAITGNTREKYFSVNTDGTLYLAKAALEGAPNLKRFVFISSVAAIGPGHGRRTATEKTPCKPVSDYGHSKLKAEDELKKQFSTLPLTVIRPSIVYGPRDQHFLTFFKFAKKGLFPVPYPYERYYSIVHVDDLVDAIYRASLHEAALGQTYIICNPEFYSLESMAQQIGDAFNKEVRFIRIPRALLKIAVWAGEIYSWFFKKEVMFTRKKYPEFMASSWIYSPKKAMAEFDFKVNIPLTEGAKTTAKWYLEQKIL